MRTLLVITLALIGLAPAALAAQEGNPGANPKHIAVETTTLVLDRERVQRMGLDGIVVSSGDVAVGTSGRSAGGVRVGSRVGGLGVSAWLDLVRRKQAVRRESKQKIVVLSGSAAQLSSGHTVVAPYGHAVSAGPRQWVEPVALEGGRVRLRLGTALSELHAGPYGTVWQNIPVEASTEIVVPSGMPVLVASTNHTEDHSHRGLLQRGNGSAATQAWIVAIPRIVDDPAQAFEMPEGIPKEWLKP